MRGYSTLAECFQNLREEENRGITYINGLDNDCFISYKQLYENALRLLFYLQDYGIKNGDELVIQLNENKEVITYFWACILGGIIPIPVTISENSDHKLKLFNIWNKLTNPYLVTTEKQLNSLCNYGEDNDLDSQFKDMRCRTLVTNNVVMQDRQGESTICSPQDIAFVQFSSGSTGDPKGVILTHENLVTNINAILACSKITNGDACLSWMPLSHDMGLIGMHMAPLYKGINQYIMPTTLFVRKPLLWLQKLSQYKVTVTASPNFGYHYLLTHLSNKDHLNFDLSQVRLIYNGAEPISAELTRKFFKSMEKYNLSEKAMFPVYGMAEASLAVTFPPTREGMKEVRLDRRHIKVGDNVFIYNDDEMSNNSISFVDLGYAINNCSVRVCDEQDMVLNENIIGHVQILGSNVTRGYYNSMDVTLSSFTEDGWLKTGDLGFIRDNRLIITGRAKDIIFIGGCNYYPHDIERIAAGVESVELGKVAACSVFNNKLQKEDVVVFVRYKGDVSRFIPLAIKIQKHINANLGIKIKSVIPISNVFKTTSGKIQRYKLSKIYEDGEFELIEKEINSYLEIEKRKEIIKKPKNATEEMLLQIFKQVLSVEEFSTNQSFLEFGGDSIMLSKAFNLIENVFPSKIAIADLFAYPTISELSQYIDNKGLIILETIDLPEKFLNVFGARNGSVYHNFEIKQAMLNKLRYVCRVENIKISEFLLGILIYSLSEICSNEKITVQTMIHENDLIVPISIDFNEISDFTMLFRLLHEISQHKHLGTAYRTDNINDIKLTKKLGAIVPLFYLKNLNSSNSEISMVYDIVFEVNETTDNIQVLCLSNGNIIKKEEINQFVNYYINMLDSVASEY